MNTRKTFIAAATTVAVSVSSITAAGAAQPTSSEFNQEQITGSLEKIFKKPAEQAPAENPEAPAPAEEALPSSDLAGSDLAESQAGSTIGLLAIVGTLGAAGWAAFEWLKHNPQQLTVRF